MRPVTMSWTGPTKSLTSVVETAMNIRYRYQFQYGYWAQATVTVRTADYDTAVLDARETLDERYEKQGKEPPVGWTLVLRSTDNPVDEFRVDKEPW